MINPLQFPCRLFLSPPPPCIFCFYPGVLVGGDYGPTEAEFLDVIGTKVLRDFTPPPPTSKIWFETGL